MTHYRRYIWHFVKAYLLVLLPLMSISVIVLSINIKKLEDERKDTLRQKVNTIEYQMSTWTRSHHEKSVALFQNNEVSPQRVLESSINARDAILLLHNVKLFDEGVSDIFLYYGDDRIYSALGKSKCQIYFRAERKCDENSLKTAVEQLYNAEKSISLLKTREGDYLLYHYPMNSKESNVNSINYLLPMDFWEQHLSAILTEQDLIITMEIGSERVYYRNQTGILEQLDQETALEEMKNMNMQISPLESESSIRMTLSYSPKTAYQDVQRICFFNMALLSLGILLSMLLSFMLGNRDRQRVQELTRMGYQRVVPQSKGKKRMTDGFDDVQEMLAQMIQESCRMEQSAIEYRGIMLAQISRLLFHGLIRDMQTVFKVVEECDVELYEEYYCLCGLYFDCEDDLVKYREKYVRGLQDMVKLDKGHLLVFLVELPSKDPLCRLRCEKIEQITRQLTELGLNSAAIVCSQIYSELSLANCAYMEIVGLTEQVLAKNTKESCWDSYVRKQEGSWMMHLPERMTNDFLQAVEARNSGKVLKLLGEMKKCMIGNGLCEENRKYLRYYILQMIISSLSKSEGDGGNGCVVALTKINMGQEEQFFEQIENLLSSYFAVKTPSIRFEKVIAYIDRNYMRYDLSLEELADMMKVSKTQMSKMFKMQAGCNYIDYLTKLRMEKAKELLEQTDMSVKDIMNSVGYIDKTNFSKKFKTFYGVNASVWREQRQNQGK